VLPFLSRASAHERGGSKTLVVLDRAYQVFKAHHAELLTKGEGKFALIKGDTIVDLCASYEDALIAGLKRFEDILFVQFFYWSG